MPAACIIGCDETGAAWAARFALNGWDVAVVDPDPGAPALLKAVLTRARRWYPALCNGRLPAEGQVRLATDADAAGAVRGADHVQICRAGLAPAALPADVPVALSAGLGRGGDATVAAADPLWLLPMVRVSGPEGPALARLCETLSALGMAPVLAGDDGGLRAGWQASRPPLTPETAAALGPGLSAAVGGLEGEARDAALTGLLRSLKDRDLGAGRILNAHDARCAATSPTDLGDLVRMQVLPAWIDFNGHMTESRYLFACSEITDALLHRVGVGPDYVAGGYSYYTVETHIRHLGETKVGDWLTGSVRMLMADARRMHLFVTLRRGDQVVATLEQLLLHVDMRANRACPAPPAVQDRLRAIVAAHSALPPPEGIGRRVAEQRAAG